MCISVLRNPKSQYPNSKQFRSPNTQISKPDRPKTDTLDFGHSDIVCNLVIGYWNLSHIASIIALISSASVASSQPFNAIADDGQVLLHNPQPIHAASSTWTTLFALSYFIAFATHASSHILQPLHLFGLTYAMKGST